MVKIYPVKFWQYLQVHSERHWTWSFQKFYLCCTLVWLHSVHLCCREQCRLYTEKYLDKITSFTTSSSLVKELEVCDIIASSYVHTHTHTNRHTHTHTYKQTHTHMCTHTCAHTHTNWYTHTCTHTHVYTYTYTHTCTHTHAHIHTHTHTNRHTHTHTCIHIHTHVHVHTYTHVHTLWPISYELCKIIQFPYMVTLQAFYLFLPQLGHGTRNGFVQYLTL